MHVNWFMIIYIYIVVGESNNEFPWAFFNLLGTLGSSALQTKASHNDGVGQKLMGYFNLIWVISVALPTSLMIVATVIADIILNNWHTLLCIILYQGP